MLTYNCKNCANARTHASTHTHARVCAKMLQAVISYCHSSCALMQNDREREKQAGGEEWVENVGGDTCNKGSKGDRKQMVQMGLRCLMNSRS